MRFPFSLFSFHFVFPFHLYSMLFKKRDSKKELSRLTRSRRTIYPSIFISFFFSLSLSLLSVKRAIASRGDVYTYSGVCGGGGDDYLVASSFRWNKEKRTHTHTHGPKGHQATAAAANTIIITAKGESESESSNTHTRYNNQPNFLSHSSRKSPLNKKKTLFSR